MQFILRQLPGSVGISKESVRSPLLHLNEVGKFTSVFYHNSLKDTREVFIMESGYKVDYSLAGLTGIRNVGKVSVFFFSRENMTDTLTDHNI